MPGGSVQPLEQGEQPACKDPVILRAAQPALRPEFHEFDPAIGTGELGQLADQLADVGDDQALDDGVQRQVRRRLRQGQARFLRAGQAKMQFLPLAALPFGQVDCGLVLAPLAHHGRTTLAREPWNCRGGTDPGITALVPARSL